MFTPQALASYSFLVFKVASAQGNEPALKLAKGSATEEVILLD
jgi:hypothetical protein